MPPACPADAYARRYRPASAPGAVSSRLLAHARRYAPASAPGAVSSRLLAYARRYRPATLLAPQCRRLARRMLTLVATRRPISSRPNAAGLPGGCLRSSLRAGQSAPGAVSSRLLAHARRYRPANLPTPQCRRLARRIIRFRVTKSAPPLPISEHKPQSWQTPGPRNFRDRRRAATTAPRGLGSPSRQTPSTSTPARRSSRPR